MLKLPPHLHKNTDKSPSVAVAFFTEFDEDPDTLPYDIDNVSATFDNAFPNDQPVSIDTVSDILITETDATIPPHVPLYTQYRIDDIDKLQPIQVALLLMDTHAKFRSLYPTTEPVSTITSLITRTRNAITHLFSAIKPHPSQSTTDTDSSPK